jgi:hypothetical protein
MDMRATLSELCDVFNAHDLDRITGLALRPAIVAPRVPGQLTLTISIGISGASSATGASALRTMLQNGRCAAWRWGTSIASFLAGTPRLSVTVTAKDWHRSG